MNGDIADLRRRLVGYVIGKFANIHNIREIAEDIVNQAIVECRQAQKFTPDKLNFGYLSAICNNLIHKHYRRQQWEHEHTVDIEKVADAEQTVGDKELLHQADKEIVLNTLGILREVERKIVYLRYYHDYTFSEISAEMKMNINTVLTRHRRSLEKLRPRLTRFFEYEEPFEEKYPQRTLKTRSYTLL